MLVHKYGGSSVATTSQIMDIAKKLKKLTEIGNEKIIVVVSAMGKTTNSLIEKANEITSKPNKREMDSLLSTGEAISAPLLAISLLDLGVRAISLNGYQAGIKTIGEFSKSYIKSIDTKKLKHLLKSYNIVVITGFQGINENQDITTLGRGGSDTTAVALASTLNCPCEIYTDVEHIFTVDPKKFSAAKPIEKLSYEEMIELALGGAKVLEPRSVEIAKKYNIPIYLGKSLENQKKGSYVMKKNLESESVSGIAIKEDLAVLTLTANSSQKSFLEALLTFAQKELSSYNLLSYLTLKTEQVASISFEKAEVNNLLNLIESSTLLSKTISLEVENLSKITISGIGFVTHPKLTNEIVSLLSSNNIIVKNFIVNEFSLNLTLEKDFAMKAVSLICEKFNL